LGNDFVKFTTFNHINDYTEVGFAALDREIASSHPLVVWAPSMAMLEDYHRREVCKISPDQFVRYVEQGYVEIIGREWWLRDKSERERRAAGFPGARWTSYDDRLLNILLNFDNRPLDQVHVRIVPDETGYQWAAEVLDEESKNADSGAREKSPIIRDIQGMLRRGEVPAGTAERARRVDTPEKQAIEVLRDVKNHTDAYIQADGKGFIMSPEDSRFLQLLERNPNLAAVRAAAHVTETLPRQVYSAEFEEATLSLLERLAHPGLKPRFDQFVGSEAHRDLVKFTGTMYDDAQIVKLEALGLYIQRELRRKVKDSIPDHSWWPKSWFERMKVMNEWRSLAVQVVKDPTGVATLGGLGLSVIKLMYRSLQRLGMIADDYNGPQWPFLYMFGRRARSKDYSPLLGQLWSEAQT
jgi:hypothetical protein